MKKVRYNKLRLGTYHIAEPNPDESFLLHTSLCDEPIYPAQVERNRQKEMS